MVQVHLTLDHEDLRAQRNPNGRKNLHGVVHDTKRIMLRGLLNIVLGLSRRGGSNLKLKAVANN
jgi:hypothetical protein